MQVRAWKTAAAASRSPVHFDGECEAVVAPHAYSGVAIRRTNSLSTLCIRTVRVNGGSTQLADRDVDIHHHYPVGAL